MRIFQLSSLNKGRIVNFLLLLLVPINMMAQELDEDYEFDNVLDDLFFSEDMLINELTAMLSPQNYLYFGVAYNSQTNFAGRNIRFKQYNFIPQVSYFHKSGFNLSVSGIFYERFKPQWDLTNVALSYYNTIGKSKIIDYSLGYSRTFYSDGWNVLTNSLDADIGIRNKKRTIGTELTFSFSFGNDESYQLISTTYGNIVFLRKPTYLVRFRPRVNIIITQQIIALRQINTDGPEPFPELVFNEIFDLLNTQFVFPISLSTNSIDLQLGYTHNFPNPIRAEQKLKSSSSFNLSLGFLIGLRKKKDLELIESLIDRL